MKQSLWNKYGRSHAVAIGFFVVGLVMAGCGKPNGAGAAAQGRGTEVAVVTVQPERVTITTELPGRVSAFLMAEVRPQVSGILQQRLFEEGADVNEGDILYRIDPAMYEAAYAGAKASLIKAEANLTSIRLRAERYKGLVEIKAISQQDYDDITSALKQAEAGVEAGKAAVETARINLAYTSITAPISGRIGKSSVTIGALATAFQPVPFATIQQLNQVYVDVPQSSANLLSMKRNIASGSLKGDSVNLAKVKLLLEDGTSYPLEGTLKFSDVTVDPSTGSFILRMIFPNPDQVLLPGMYARAVIEEGVREQAILVPQQGVTRDLKGNPVALIVDEEGKVQSRTLMLDQAIGTMWLLSSGLVPGDRVIVEGMNKVRPGASVKAVPFSAAKKSGTGAGKPVLPTE